MPSIYDDFQATTLRIAKQIELISTVNNREAWEISLAHTRVFALNLAATSKSDEDFKESMRMLLETCLREGMVIRRSIAAKVEAKK